MKQFIYIFFLLSLVPQLVWASYFSQQKASSINMDGLPRSSVMAIYTAFDQADYLDHENFAKKRYFWVIDFTLHNSQKRGLLIDLKKGKIERYLVSHGENSDNGYGYAVRFSNIPDSHQSSLGLYQTAEKYSGKHGKSLRLEGLESTNDMAHDRAIVIHSADYVSSDLARDQGKIGNSEGCPAVEKNSILRIIRKLNPQGFVYIFHEKFSNRD